MKAVATPNATNHIEMQPLYPGIGLFTDMQLLQFTHSFVHTMNNFVRVGRATSEAQNRIVDFGAALEKSSSYESR